LPIVARVSAVVDGAEVVSSIDRTPGDVYESFSVDLIVLGPAESAAVDIRFVADAAASICVDELVLEFVAAPPTETPTETPTSTTTPATPANTATTVASASPTVPPTQTATSGPTGNGLVFINGGFEDGIAGWSKFGGELSAAASPRMSGARAGRLTSATESTKWAYQPVRIDAAKTYEFQGYIATDEGVSEAYLRISWYVSDEASGSALSSTDSLSQLAGGSDFSHLTTGPVAPPPDAHSARLRVMLAPASGSTATIFLDDFSFGTTTAAPSTHTPVPAPTMTRVAQVAGSTATSTRDATPRPSASPDASNTPERSTPSATVTASESGQVAAVSTRGGGLSALQGVDEPEATPLPDSDTPAWVYIALPAIPGLLGAGYWVSKRRQSP
jgi:hypothetical protein